MREWWKALPAVLLYVCILVCDAQTQTACELVPAQTDAVFSVLSVRPWQAGDALPPPDVIGLTTNDMFHKRYRLTNGTIRPLFYLTDLRTIFPAGYVVHKADEKDDWIRPFRGDEGIRPKDSNGFLAGTMYQWLELPPHASVEFENDEWYWGRFQALAIFVNDKPVHKGRRELISNAIECHKSK